jgi:hypothetical protein
MIGTITHAYVTVGLVGVTAFLMLLLCGDRHLYGGGELAGSEVTVQSLLSSRPPRSYPCPELPRPRWPSASTASARQSSPAR